jgi:hypothetical protein
MNIFSEYLENQRKETKGKKNIGNAYITPTKEQRKKEKEAENEMPLVRLQNYLENKISKDKEIAPLFKIAVEKRWSDPSLSRKNFFAARTVLLKRCDNNEATEEEKLFINWFNTIDDMIAFKPVKFETDISEYEDDKKSLKNNIVGEIDPSKVIKKHMKEPVK